MQDLLDSLLKYSLLAVHVLDKLLCCSAPLGVGLEFKRSAVVFLGCLFWVLLLFWLFTALRWVKGSLFVDLGAEEVGKLTKADLCITIGVDTSDDSEHLPIDETATELPEEVLEINFSDLANSELNEGLVGRLWGIVRLVFELLDQSLHTLDEVNLMLDDVEQANLDVIWKVIEAANPRVGSLLSLCSEQVVVAG